MRFSKLSIAALSTILTSAVALPAAATGTLPIAGAPSPTPKTPALNFGFQLKDVQVHCPDNEHQRSFAQCYSDNSGKNCDPMPDQADRHACSQLWEIMCANRIGCQVSG